jgi:hypothetical protein
MHKKSVSIISTVASLATMICGVAISNAFARNGSGDEARLLKSNSARRLWIRRRRSGSSGTWCDDSDPRDTHDPI